MGKRSSFARNPRDFYPTPYEAVLPLLPHVSGDFSEPCAGDAALKDHLVRHGLRCDYLSDIEPLGYNVARQDVFDITQCRSQFITNPPWDRTILHPLINHLRQLAPTWLLFDADWMHTRQAVPYLLYCQKIVSVGRVKWIADSKHTGKDNCCWYLFGDTAGRPNFFGR